MAPVRSSGHHRTRGTHPKVGSVVSLPRLPPAPAPPHPALGGRVTRGQGATVHALGAPPAERVDRRAPDPLVLDHDVIVIPEPDRNVMVLTGELDRVAEPRLRALHRLWSLDPRPIVLDCTGVTFMDAGGLRFLLDALDQRPQDRLTNVPSIVARLLRTVGRADVLRTRTRHTVTIATYDGVDVVTAARIAEVFGSANGEGCSYDLVTAAFRTDDLRRPRRRPPLALPGGAGAGRMAGLVSFVADRPLDQGAHPHVRSGDRHRDRSVPPGRGRLPRRSSSCRGPAPPISRRSRPPCGRDGRSHRH